MVLYLTSPQFINFYHNPTVSNKATEFFDNLEYRRKTKLLKKKPLYI